MTMGSDAIVVGGGLGGLSAAVRLARAGRSVALIERSSRLGGRAQTQEHRGFWMNLGPHAVYPGAAALLGELGVPVRGAKPAVRGFALHDGALHTLPSGFVSLLTTGLFTLAEKLEVARLLAALPGIDARAFDRVTVRRWVEGALAGERARAFVEALFRLTTYADAPKRQSAGYALRLVQLVLQSNVLYLDGGWQVLVDALADAARTAGVRIITGASVVALGHEGGGTRSVRLDDGTSLSADHVVLAMSPRGAADLVGAASALGAWAARATPARAASLDLALSALPAPRASFALGVDRPLYFSVHSDAAALAPAGGALIHVAKYLDPDEANGGGARSELEALVDRMQPGWRGHVVHARFLPSLVVANAIAIAAEGGETGRPGHRLTDAPGVFVVGDWVGEGHLAEASLASAKRAAEAIVGRGRSAAAA